MSKENFEQKSFGQKECWTENKSHMTLGRLFLVKDGSTIINLSCVRVLTK